MAERKGLDPVCAFDWDSTKHQPERFLDGPVSTRVAVLDFDEETGAVMGPIVFDPSGGRAEYDVPRSPADRSFQAVSVFATVHKALTMFESKDVLGRRIDWAFDGPQLLVVPRAGNWRNAYYERESRSLQFFSFAGDDRRPVIHTSLSLDIVSHEVGHAILDAVAPSLYDSVTTQSLAIHEAVGDLSTLFMTLDVNPLRETLLNQTRGNIRGLNAYTQVAEEFGFYTGRGGALRSLWNNETLADIDNPNDFHHMSQVLTGAVYELLVEVYEQRWKTASDNPDNPQLSRSGKALVDAANLVRRLALRGLDYLPPGEISFADYGRAVIAADAVSNPDNAEYRETFARLLGARIGVSARRLGFTNPPADRLRPVDVDALETSDWHAYQLVGENRPLFHVPDGLPFRVEARQAIEKTTWRSGGTETTYRELILKVSWEQLEDGTVNRWVRFGTTIAFDADTGTITALVTTNPEVTGEDHRAERERFLQYLLDNDFVDYSHHGPEARGVRDREGLRVTGTGRCLHIAGAEDPPSRTAPGKEPR